MVELKAQEPINLQQAINHLKAKLGYKYNAIIRRLKISNLINQFVSIHQSDGLTGTLSLMGEGG